MQPLRCLLSLLISLLFTQNSFAQSGAGDTLLLAGPNDPLPAGAVLIDSVVTTSKAQMAGDAYYHIVLAEAKVLAIQKGGNLLQANHYHNFSLIPFGASLHSKVYRLNAADYNTLLVQQQTLAAQHQAALEGKCVVHFKNYTSSGTELYLNDSSFARLRIRNPKGDTVRRRYYRHEYTFVFPHGGILTGRGQQFKFPAGGCEIKPGNEYFFICGESGGGKNHTPHNYLCLVADPATFYYDY